MVPGNFFKDVTVGFKKVQEALFRCFLPLTTVKKIIKKWKTGKPVILKIVGFYVGHEIGHHFWNPRYLKLRKMMFKKYLN